MYKAISTLTALFICSWMLGQTTGTANIKTEAVDPNQEVVVLKEQHDVPLPDTFDDAEQYEQAKEKWVNKNSGTYNAIISAGRPAKATPHKEEEEDK